MTERSIFSHLTREPDGAISGVYKAFVLQSALQPIFRENDDGELEIEAFAGLIRASLDGVPCPPTDFFLHMPEEDRATVDSLCRSLHILNAGALGRRDAALIVNVHPGLFTTAQMIRQEIERLRLAAHQAGIPAGRIACEIREQPDDDPQSTADLAARLHEGGFKVAVTGYAGETGDLERLKLMQPDFVTFNGFWLRDFTRNSAGLALVRVLVGQFAREGIRAIVSGIEEPEEIALCRDLGDVLMQGYLLARPEIAPTSFNLRFPEKSGANPAFSGGGPAASHAPAPEPFSRAMAHQRHFGRRRPT